MDSEPQTHCHDPREIVYVVNKRDTRVNSKHHKPMQGFFKLGSYFVSIVYLLIF
jgi:hypothetical protein